MRLKQHAIVVTAEGKEVGHVDRVVMDPKTKAVTHVIVHKGLLFTEDKVVPLDLIDAATEERVTLHEGAGDLQTLPVFEEKHYVMVGGEQGTEGGAGMPPSASAPYWPLASDPTTPRYIAQTKINIPDETVAVAAGAKVISADDKYVGNVEQVLTEAQADRATYFVISEGLLLKTRRLVPATWVSTIMDDEVHLTVSAHELERLPEDKG